MTEYSRFPASGYESELRPRRRRAAPGRWIGIGVTVALVAGLVALAPWDPTRMRAYADQWVVWTEPPPAAIEDLAERLALTEDGRRIFFASRPSIESSDDFLAHCPAEGKVLLGCYDGQIYVYAVTEERLAGTVEVTAAHELLHAVYDRLGEDERERVDALVASVVAALPETDADVQVVSGYPARQQAGEWYARVGSTRRDVPSALEDHLARYFADGRERVLAYAEGSTAELDGYRARIDELVDELDREIDSLDARAARYDEQFAAYERDFAVLQSRASSGDFASVDEFEAEYAAIQQRWQQLESDRLRLNDDIAAYNDKVAELERLDSDYRALFSKLDVRTGG